MTSITSQPENNRRYRVRFGIRFLFVLLLLSALPSLWMQQQIVTLKRQRRAMDRLSFIDSRIETEPASPAWIWRCVPKQLCASREVATSVEIVRDRITGDDIAPLAELSSLRSLTIRAEGPTDGELARVLTPLRSLLSANLTGHAVGDECLRALVSAKSLRQLNLTHAWPTRAGIACLTALTRLEELDLFNARIDDDSFAAILSAKRLTWLMLPGSLSDRSLMRLHELRALGRLDLHLEAASDAGISTLYLLPCLQILHLHGSGLTDVGLAHVSRIQTLKDLRISSAKLTVEGVILLGEMPLLRSVTITESGITSADLPAICEAAPRLGPRVLRAHDSGFMRRNYRVNLWDKGMDCTRP